MTDLSRYHKRLRVLIMARLFIATFLLFYIRFVFPSEHIIFFAQIAAIALLSFMYLIWLISGRHLRTLAVIQITLDLLLESTLIYFTGGTESVFAAIYVLSILSAGYLLSPITSFYIAGGSSLLFVGIVSADYLNLIPLNDIVYGKSPQRGHDLIYLFYVTYVRISMYLIVAFLTYYFSI